MNVLGRKKSLLDALDPTHLILLVTNRATSPIAWIEENYRTLTAITTKNLATLGCSPTTLVVFQQLHFFIAQRNQSAPVGIGK